MVPGDTEMALGLIHDDQFGPVVLVAAGGVHIELLADRALALPPGDSLRAPHDRLTVDATLAGRHRGPRRRRERLTAVVVAFSNLALDLGTDCASSKSIP
jgi:hypothetical protein